METQLELIGVLCTIYPEWKDLHLLSDQEESLIASNFKRFTHGLESSIQASYLPFVKTEKFSAFRKPKIYNIEFENFVMSNNYYDEYSILFSKLSEWLAKTDKKIWKWFDIEKSDSFNKDSYMIPFGQFLAMLKKENDGAVVMVNKILFKELINLILSKKNCVTFKGAIALVINLSAYLHELKGRLGERYEDLVKKLEEIRVFRVFLLRLMIPEVRANPATKVHGIDHDDIESLGVKKTSGQGSKRDLVSVTEGQLSQQALDTLEALIESKARGEFLPKGFSLVAVVH
jgi:hypothetical protein